MKDFKKIWFISLIVKLVLAALIPFSGDESYYWVWSHRMQLSYFDHPPMVAWLFYLGHFLEPWGQAVRWPGVLLGHLTMLVWYGILKDHLPWDKIRWWVYLALFSPLLGVGSLIITPDVPVVFFWSLSLYFLLRAESKKDLLSYAALGMSLGLGFCAKYHIVVFVPCLIAYMLLEKRWKTIQWKWVPATLVAGVLFSLPVLLWNYRNDFISFRFQLSHGLDGGGYEFKWTSDYVLSQILLIFPLIFWAALRGRPSRDLRALLYFAWGPLLFFLWSSFKASGEANWAIIAYPAVFALALYYSRIAQWTKIYSWFWGVALAVFLVITFTPALRKSVGKINESYYFEDMSHLALEYKPLYAQTHQLTSAIWYFTKNPTYKIRGMNRYDFYDTLPESIPSGNLFYLIKRPETPMPDWVGQEKWQSEVIKALPPEYQLVKFYR